ncbi:MAG TPA: class I SAM-dependent methyltransferase [Mycobacteriales bacterium]|nr:class I SAM-dependent methyltransferase [Mycobacteriales bacterium]
MTVDHYAGAAKRWAEGATIVYRPIAHDLLAASPHRLTGRTVVDAGAGTGVVSDRLSELGARPVAIDMSHDMMAWNAVRRPPAAVADVNRLPLHDGAVDDMVAAFVFNHVTQPEAAIAEAARVIRPGGALLARVYSNSSRSEVRDALDLAQQSEGWRAPKWYVQLKQSAARLLGSAENMAATASAAGLAEVTVDECAVEVGVTKADQLVDYRLGQAQFAAWLATFDPRAALEMRDRLVESIRPIMQPYRPIVVFLAAQVR